MSTEKNRKKLCRPKTASKSSNIEEIERIVSYANSVSCEALLKYENNSNSSLNIDCCCGVFTVKCLHPSDLSSEEKFTVFNILEHNMKDLYLKSAWGWNGEAKFNELFAPESRLLLCYLNHIKTTCEAGRHEMPPLWSPSDTNPCAFVHFRFEVDTKRPVLYCYEIQLLDTVRGMKLGQNLLQILYKIAGSNKMTRVMLTAFKVNTPAYVFFGKNGFKVDISDLSNDGKYADYSIMSRRP